MVYILLGEGFEEVEAILPCDLLRRAEIPVQLAGIGALHITGGHGISVQADCLAEPAELVKAQMLVLPGGLRGVQSIAAAPEIMRSVKQAYENGAYVAAICAAPTLLAALGITDGKNAVCYPGMDDQMGKAKLCGAPAVTDGRVITAKAAGTAYAFALELITALRGAQCARQVAKGIVLQ